MKSRFTALALGIIMMLSLLPAQVVVAADRIDVPDTAMDYNLYKTTLGQVYDFDDTSSNPASQIFDYDVPDGGAAVIVFFIGDGSSRDSNEFVKDLANTKWAADPNVNLVAVESYMASKSEVQAFVDEYDNLRLIDHIYYNPDQNYTIAWYLKSIELGGNMKNQYSFGVSATFAHVLIVTKQAGKKVINYSVPGIYSTELITSLLGTVADIPDGRDDTVSVRTSGVNYYDYVQPIVDEINSQRTSAGVAALTLSSQLTEIAMLRAAECSLYYNHIRPNGYSCFSLGTDTNMYPSGTFLAENIACGQKTPAEVMTAWMNSTGHRMNILRDNVTQVGIGCFENNGVKYWVQVFGDGTDRSALASTQPVENTFTIETLQSKISDVTSVETITLPVGTACDCSILNMNMGTTEHFHFESKLVPVMTTALKEDGTVVAYIGADGLLHGVSPGTGTINLKAYTGEEIDRVITVNVADHVWGKAVVTKESSCTEDGTRVYTCLTCGQTKEETIPGGHRFTDGFVVDIEPTYKSEGEKSRHCLVCGERTDITVIKRLISQVRGDVDLDGEVTAKDLLAMRLKIAGLEMIGGQGFTNGDVFVDVEINMKDIVLVRKIIVGLE